METRLTAKLGINFVSGDSFETTQASELVFEGHGFHNELCIVFGVFPCLFCHEQVISFSITVTYVFGWSWFSNCSSFLAFLIFLFSCVSWFPAFLVFSRFSVFLCNASLTPPIHTSLFWDDHGWPGVTQEAMGRLKVIGADRGDQGGDKGFPKGWPAGEVGELRSDQGGPLMPPGPSQHNLLKPICCLSQVAPMAPQISDS